MHSLSTLAIGGELQRIPDDGDDAFNTRGQVVHTGVFFKSCILHANVPSLISQGSVTRYPAIIYQYNRWLKIIQKHHVTKGCGQLYPSEVRQLRNHLLSVGDPASIQMWMMILLGIQLFLRADELVSMKVEDFIHSYYPEGKEKNRIQVMAKMR
jgi:hypothetical protein